MISFDVVNITTNNISKKTYFISSCKNINSQSRVDISPEKSDWPQNMTYSEDIRVLPRESYQDLPTGTNIFSTRCGLFRISTNTLQRYVRIFSKMVLFFFKFVQDSPMNQQSNSTVIVKAEYFSFLMSLPRSFWIVFKSSSLKIIKLLHVDQNSSALKP